MTSDIGFIDRFRKGIGSFREARIVFGLMEKNGFLGTIISEGREGKKRRYSVCVDFTIKKWYRSQSMAKRKLFREYEQFLKRKEDKNG